MTQSGFNFVVDNLVRGRIYPAFAKHQARPFTQSWREFDYHYPYTVPIRLQEYCQEQNFPINIYYAHDSLPDNCFYPIHLGFFDFGIDYVQHLPHDILRLLNDDRLKLLFLYHEGDNPHTIRARLDSICEQHQISKNCWRFVSSNSEAQRIDRFIWFNDFEFWYYQRNLETKPLAIRDQKTYDFTALVRVHKPWRAAVMADLHRDNLLTNSLWSYCNVDHDVNTDGPIEVDTIAQLRYSRDRFLQNAPYYCDDLNNDDRNNHKLTVDDHFQNSYFNIIIESQMDVDQSGGVFLTEKTFKPIKHGQPFFIVGAAGSLQVLRDLGYRTFDHVIDNSYDQETDATQRWIMLKRAIKQARDQGLQQVAQLCRNDVEHNQQLFMSCHYKRLNSLEEKLHGCS